ncbi:MAG TPA: isoaspartyl peptidase/L-asparaginase [Chthoniobacterales bacterium]
MTGSAQETPNERPKFMFVMHGGAGAIKREEMTPELEQEYRATLTEALQTGHRILSKNGSALDAVEASIRILEDSPLFNAGKGAVFTSAGTNELDSSIMDGRTLAAGAVAGVKHIKNPISLARMVMEKSKHVMIIGDGAEAFAKEQGVDLVPESYFRTERRWEELQKEKRKAEKKPAGEDGKRGTVGAVALDMAGNLAAGTSTGGMTNKRVGRVGDSPIIGAGTYADNQSCAVSGTGDGEYFIRADVAHEISALVAYKDMSVSDAAESALAKAEKLGGKGGVIALDRNGSFAMPFNSDGMYRGHIGPDGKAVVEIYKE